MNFAEKSEKSIRKTHFSEQAISNEKSLFLNKSRKSLFSRSTFESFNEHEPSFNERHHELNEFVLSSSFSIDSFSHQSYQPNLKNASMNQSIRPDSIKRESGFGRNYSLWLSCIRTRQNTMTRMIAFHSN